jgi:hypothetical protein
MRMISIRSSSGCRHVQRVGRRHEHHVRQVVIDLQIVVVERRVLLGIEHFQQAEAGSPRKSCPSCRSRRAGTAGCVVFAFFIDWMILPGIEPI